MSVLKIAILTTNWRGGACNHAELKTRTVYVPGLFITSWAFKGMLPALSAERVPSKGQATLRITKTFSFFKFRLIS